MKNFRLWFIFSGLLLPFPAQAMVDNPDYLILYPGETIERFGTIYKNVSICVNEGAGIYLPLSATAESAKWSLQLVAPAVYIGGTINANAVSYLTTGIGADAISNTIGAGGSGYGNDGGDGMDHYNSHGHKYGSTYREGPGTMGYNSLFGGGGSIRIDALSLTLASTALLMANADTGAMDMNGSGGSGGCIFLHSPDTFLLNGYKLLAQGGAGVHFQIIFHVIPGMPPTIIVEYKTPSGGGGGGGRIKLFHFPDYYDEGGLISVNPGPAGGPTAYMGVTGEVKDFTPVGLPALVLLAPLEGQIVGRAPTFNIYGADSQASQFLKYKIEISPDAAFASITHTASQLEPDAGWQGNNFFKSAQLAAYTMPWELTSGATYYWRACVTNYNGNSFTAYTSARSFTTLDNARPLPPVLIYPAENQIYVSKLPALQVAAADPNGNSLTFTVTISQSPTLSNPKIFQVAYPGWDSLEYPSPYNYAGVTATCQIQNTTENPDALEPGVKYYWQSTAYDQYQETAVSGIGSFTVVAKPTVPLLTAPANASISITRRPVFNMHSESPTAGPLRYQLEISQDGFQTVTTYNSASGNGWNKTQYDSGETAELAIPEAYALIPGKTYAWRVKAYDIDNDNWSALSPVFGVTIITPPLTAVLLSPADRYLSPDPAIKLQCKAESESGNTLTYRVELSEDQFANVWKVFDQGSQPANWSAPEYASGATAVFTIPALANLQRGKNYWWRALANDGVTWGPASETRSFSIANSLEISGSKIYPNPAVSQDSLTLELETSVSANVTMNIFNSMGKELKNYNWPVAGGRSNRLTFDIRTYAPGIYFAVIEIKSNFGSQKIIKRFAVVN